MMKSFAFMRLFPPSNSEIELREKEPQLTDGKKTEAKKAKKRSKGRLEAPRLNHCARLNVRSDGDAQRC